jgi:glycosyltransferase involved in cell wall biosynthesis
VHCAFFIFKVQAKNRLRKNSAEGKFKMTVFISNFFNHHQLEFCRTLAELTEFKFIATMKIPQEQLNLGYDDLNSKYDFVLRMYESAENKNLAQNLLNEAEIVIAGSCSFPFDMLKNRLENDRLTFWFSERLFKRGFLERFYPPKIKRVFSQCTKYKNNNFYLLCAGGFAAHDYEIYHAFREKSFVFGYFPPFVQQDEEKLSAQKSGKMKLLWAGRYLKWKHPEFAVYAAKILKKRGIEFELTMIGNGALYKKIGRMIAKYNLSDCVRQTGSVPAKKVREFMDRTNVFLFTSDRKEGWGAVLNESMNSACAVVANKKIGSAESLLIHGKNGFVYGSKKEFAKILRDELCDSEKIRRIGKNAYDSIANFWNGKISAQRFLKTAEKLLNGENLENYDYGPMKKN